MKRNDDLLLLNDVLDEHPEFPWMQMRAIRNKIVHDYRGIELEIIWDTVINNLPGLKAQVKHVLGK